MMARLERTHLRRNEVECAPFGPIRNLGEQQFRLARELPFLETLGSVFRFDVLEAPDDPRSTITAYPLSIEVDVDIHIYAASDEHGEVRSGN